MKTSHTLTRARGGEESQQGNYPPGRTGAPVSIEQRIEDYMPLIYNTALGYKRCHPTVDLDDLMQEGRLAVARAARSYDGRAAFGTYAKCWIRSFMWRWVVKHSKTVKLPFVAWYPASRVFTSEFSMDADPEVFPRALAWSAETVTDTADVRLRGAVVIEALKQLPAAQARALRQHFIECKSLTEIARLEKTSPQTVWARIEDGLARLRRMSAVRRVGNDEGRTTKVEGRKAARLTPQPSTLHAKQ